MKKRLLTIIAVTLISSSAFAHDACVEANLKGPSLGPIMGILNKNEMNYRVTKNGEDTYNVIVKAKTALNSTNINSKLISLYNLEILREADIKFTRSVEGRCLGFNEIEDITKL